MNSTSVMLQTKCGHLLAWCHRDRVSACAYACRAARRSVFCSWKVHCASACCGIRFTRACRRAPRAITSAPAASSAARVPVQRSSTSAWFLQVLIFHNFPKMLLSSEMSRILCKLLENVITLSFLFHTFDISEMPNICGN